MEDGVDESQVVSAVNTNLHTGGDSSLEEVGTTSSTHLESHELRQQQHDTTSHYGNKLPVTKSDESLLFTFLNVNGMLQDATKHKNHTIRKIITVVFGK